MSAVVIPVQIKLLLPLFAYYNLHFEFSGVAGGGFLVLLIFPYCAGWPRNRESRGVIA